jgi:hypothetical protein
MRESPENFPGFFVVLQVAYFDGPFCFPPETGLSNRTDP